jgi:hypothetical protein
MIADIIVDFENHLDHGNVYLVEIEMPLQDAPDDVPSSIRYHLYVTAHTPHQAKYIAHCMYPDADGYFSSDDPVTREEYAARRN